MFIMVKIEGLRWWILCFWLLYLILFGILDIEILEFCFFDFRNCLMVCEYWKYFVIFLWFFLINFCFCFLISVVCFWVFICSFCSVIIFVWGLLWVVFGFCIWMFFMFFLLYFLLILDFLCIDCFGVLLWLLEMVDDDFFLLVFFDFIGRLGNGVIWIEFLCRKILFCNLGREKFDFLVNLFGFLDIFWSLMIFGGEIVVNFCFFFLF